MLAAILLAQAKVPQFAAAFSQVNVMAFHLPWVPILVVRMLASQVLNTLSVEASKLLRSIRSAESTYAPICRPADNTPFVVCHSLASSSVRFAARIPSLTFVLKEASPVLV